MFEELKKYIKDTLTIDVSPEPVAPAELGSFPLFIREAYWFARMSMMSYELILIEPKTNEPVTVSSIASHTERINAITGFTVIFITYDMPAYNRRRLAEQMVNFIVPGKEMFLPSLLINIRQPHSYTKHHHSIARNKLLPSAQFIIIYYLLHHNDDIESWTLKEMAKNFNYTPTTISNAVANLEAHNLCVVKGTKEKRVQFYGDDKNECFKIAKDFFINPIARRVFVDNKPNEVMRHSNVNALAEHTDISRSKQQYYAIGNDVYIYLKAHGKLENENDREGQCCLEIWKYDPAILAKDVCGTDEVDPISLYWSLKDTTDERIEMALEQLDDLINRIISK